MENNSELKLLAARNQMLDTLFKISSTFNGLLEQDEILRQFSMYLMGQFAIKNFALYIFDHKKNKYTLLKKENIEIDHRSKLIIPTIVQHSTQTISSQLSHAT